MFRVFLTLCGMNRFLAGSLLLTGWLNVHFFFFAVCFVFLTLRFPSSCTHCLLHANCVLPLPLSGYVFFCSILLFLSSFTPYCAYCVANIPSHFFCPITLCSSSLFSCSFFFLAFQLLPPTTIFPISVLFPSRVQPAPNRLASSCGCRERTRSMG